MTNASTGLVLVDTNVLVYLYDPADDVKQHRAEEVLDALIRRGFATLSFQVLGEFYNSVTRRIAQPLSPEEGERRVSRLAASCRVLDLTPETVMAAIQVSRAYQVSYWDGLIWAAAKLNGVGTVLTEDIQSRPAIEGVRFVNPFALDFEIAVLGI
jgi:predicted nucleic acid-binding protein